MASSFPGAIDSFTDPLSGSALNSPSHSAQHADLNDAAEKIETFVLDLPRGVVGFAENTTLAQTGVTTIVDITGLTVTFTGVAGRRYRVDGSLLLQSTVNGDTVNLIIRNSAGTFLNQGIYPLPSNAVANMCAVSLVTTATGSTTFKLSFQRQAGTGTMTANGGGTFPAQIVVTDIGKV